MEEQLINGQRLQKTRLDNLNSREMDAFLKSYSQNPVVASYLLKIGTYNKKQGQYRDEYKKLWIVYQDSKKEFYRMHGEFEVKLAECLEKYGSDFSAFKKEMDDFMKNYRSTYNSARVVGKNCTENGDNHIASVDKLLGVLNEFYQMKDENNFIFEFSDYNEPLTYEGFVEILKNNKEMAKKIADDIRKDLPQIRKIFREDNEKLGNTQESVRISQNPKEKNYN